MSNTEENFQIQKSISWEQTPLLPTTKTLNATTPHSCLHLFLARTARPLGLGLGLTARAYPVCPGPRPSLTLQLRSHPEHGGFPGQPQFEFPQAKAEDTAFEQGRLHREVSLGLCRCRWEEGRGHPSWPGLRGPDLSKAACAGRRVLQPHGHLEAPTQTVSWSPLLPASLPTLDPGNIAGQARLCRDGVCKM